jgi:hypothetical protein
MPTAGGGDLAGRRGAAPGVGRVENHWFRSRFAALRTFQSQIRLENHMEARTWRPRRPRLGTVLGGLALFVALQGTALALPGVNTVDSGDITNGQVKQVDIGTNAVRSRALATVGTVTGPPVNVAPGASGSATAICPPGSQVISVGYQRGDSGLSVGNIEILGVGTARVTGFNHSGAAIALAARAFCLAP